MPRHLYFIVGLAAWYLVLFTGSTAGQSTSSPLNELVPSRRELHGVLDRLLDWRQPKQDAVPATPQVIAIAPGYPPVASPSRLEQRAASWAAASTILTEALANAVKTLGLDGLLERKPPTDALAVAAASAGEGGDGEMRVATSNPLAVYQPQVHLGGKYTAGFNLGG